MYHFWSCVCLYRHLHWLLELQAVTEQLRSELAQLFQADKLEQWKGGAEDLIAMLQQKLTLALASAAAFCIFSLRNTFSHSFSVSLGGGRPWSILEETVMKNCSLSLISCWSLMASACFMDSSATRAISFWVLSFIFFCSSFVWNKQQIQFSLGFPLDMSWAWHLPKCWVHENKSNLTLF